MSLAPTFRAQGLKDGGGRTSVSPASASTPSASASASLPGLGCSLTLFLPPPPRPTSRLSSGKLQEFGVGDGSKLTLVPTVEAGLMVNG